MNKKPYNILLLHNSYLNRGGEDNVVKNEYNLLKERANNVRLMTFSNRNLQSLRPIDKFLKTVSKKGSIERIERVINEFKPDILHVHNWMPQINVAPYICGRKHSIPVVHTLHNYRLICLNGLLLLNGHKCELCVSGNFLHGVYNRCYRTSLLQSGAAALLSSRMQSYLSDGYGDAFIVLSELQKQILLKNKRIPADKLHVKPNFAPYANNDHDASRGDRDGLLFVGRLSKEKGLEVAIRALRAISLPPALTVIGEGPQMASLRRLADGLPVRFLGALPNDEVQRYMRKAKIFLFPSICYEAMPLTAIEAMANGAIVISSQNTGAAEAVGEAGWLATAGDTEDWAKKIAAAYKNDTEGAQKSHVAIERFRHYFSATASYNKLISIYSSL